MASLIDTIAAPESSKIQEWLLKRKHPKRVSVRCTLWSDITLVVSTEQCHLVYLPCNIDGLARVFPWSCHLLFWWQEFTATIPRFKTYRLFSVRFSEVSALRQQAYENPNIDGWNCQFWYVIVCHQSRGRHLPDVWFHTYFPIV